MTDPPGRTTTATRSPASSAPRSWRRSHTWNPGNVAANITSGARYGYLLVWVLVLANCMSVLIQYQSAKLGIVTGKSLPEILGERLGDAGRFMFFMQAEVIAIATDLAEVIGGAIGAETAVRPAAVRRRLHHRRGVDGAADFRKRRHASHFRKTHHRPAAGDHVRFHRRPVHRPAKSERSRRRLDSTLQRHRHRAHGHVHAGCHGHAARHHTCIPRSSTTITPPAKRSRA